MLLWFETMCCCEVWANNFFNKREETYLHARKERPNKAMI